MRCMHKDARTHFKSLVFGFGEGVLDKLVVLARELHHGCRATC
jgi:hypothetical protein